MYEVIVNREVLTHGINMYEEVVYVLHNRSGMHGCGLNYRLIGQASAWQIPAGE